ncbi:MULTISPECIES: DUF5681 domain-containing protein [unclassified Bradyrhizobium]
MSRDNDGGNDYKVGYRRPPRHGQFKKGQSGNPSGGRKPRKPIADSRPIKTIADVLYEELQQEVTVRENGKKYKITKMEALVKGAVNHAMQGDIRPLKLVQGIEPVLDSSLKAIEARDRESADARERVTEKLEALSRRLQMRASGND